MAACVGLFADAPIGAGLNPTFSWEPKHAGQTTVVIGGSTSVGQYGVSLSYQVSDSTELTRTFSHLTTKISWLHAYHHLRILAPRRLPQVPWGYRCHRPFIDTPPVFDDRHQRTHHRSNQDCVRRRRDSRVSAGGV